LAKYGKTKEEVIQALSENVGDDYVNKDEKLKRMGAKELGSSWTNLKYSGMKQWSL
jgi:hypothetical protein